LFGVWLAQHNNSYESPAVFHEEAFTDSLRSGASLRRALASYLDDRRVPGSFHCRCSDACTSELHQCLPNES